MRLLALPGIAVAALLLSNCSANNNTSVNSDWSVTVGAFGGVTGGAAGTTIDATGHTSKWTMATATSQKLSEPGRTLDKSDIEFFQHYLEQVHFDTITSGTPSNKNLFVEVMESGKPHRVSWGMGNHATSAGISALQRFYEVVTTYLSAQGGH